VWVVVLQWAPDAQSVSVAQVVPHAVAEAQANLPGHGAALPTLQLPIPSHALAVSIPPAHAGVPHPTPAE
jgi:hypothetical protein